MIAWLAAALRQQTRGTIFRQAAQQTKHLTPPQPDQRTGVRHAQTARPNPQQHIEPAVRKRKPMTAYRDACGSGMVSPSW